MTERDSEDTILYLSVNNEQSVVIHGHSIRITRLEPEETDFNDPHISIPSQPHLILDGEDIGPISSGEMSISNQSISFSVNITAANFDSFAFLRSVGYIQSVQEWADRYFRRIDETNEVQTQTTRQRAYVGDPCSYQDGNHESYFVDGHWICNYCRRDTCLKGDCPYDG